MSRSLSLRAALLLAALVSALGVLLAPAQPAQAAPATFQLLGRVTDALTGKPIGDVVITLFPPDPVAPLVVASNPGGHYGLKGLLRDQVYEISVIATGYNSLVSDPGFCDSCQNPIPPVSQPPDPVKPAVVHRNFALTPN